MFYYWPAFLWVLALKKLDGTTISNSAKYKEIQFLEPANHYIIERS